MALTGVDTTRALRTVDELTSLVEAVFNAAPTDESNWVEWKGGLDLSAAEGRFSVAKAILGFSNRSVAQAKLACEGVSYLVVGVAPGSASGVAAVDPAELSQRIKTYAIGPRWTPHFIPFRDVQVLVIIVEPPHPGDPIHTLQKAYSSNVRGKSGHYEGTIFHRSTGHTEPAGSKDIEMLSKRLVDGNMHPDLALVVEPSADPVTRLDLSSATLEDWFKRREKHVRAKSGKPPPPPPPMPPPPDGFPHSLAAIWGGNQVGQSLGGMFTAGIFATPKDTAEFDRRVQDYLSEYRRVLTDFLVHLIVKSDENKVVFRVGNETDVSVTGIQLTASIPSHGIAVYGSPPAAPRLPRMPRWPAPGDDMLERITASAGLADTYEYDLNLNGPSVTERNGAFEIVWDLGNLRPWERSDALSVTIVAGPIAPETLTIAMVARSMSHRGVSNANANVEINPDAWTIGHWLRAEPRE